MKKLNLLLPALILLAANQLLAQGKAIISGKISSPLSNQVELVIYPNPLIPEEVTTEVTLDGKSFRLEVPVKEATVAELQHGDEVVQVYLEPGYELIMNANGKNFLKSLKYKGKGANENNYLANYTYRFEEEEEYQVLPDNIKLKEQQFTEFLDYRREDQLASFEKYTGKKEVSEQFSDFLKAEIDFSYATDKLSYHPLRQQVMQVSLSKPSAAFYDYLSELDLNRPANLLSPSFVNFLRNYTAYFAKEAGYQEANPQYFKVRYQVAEQKLKGQAKLLAQAQVLKQSIQQGHLKYTEQMLEDFNVKNRDRAGNEYLARLYNENTTLVTGGIAPDFMLQNVDGDTVSLSDYRGKLVYLNFWRSDCGLCHVELPHLQRLTGKLGNHKIVFLNIAVGDDEAQWRKLVQKKELQGEHVLAKGADAALAKQYGLKDVPAYFLIDEEGRFISLKARRPSDHEAANDILQHLEVRQVSLK
ncbi:TlpA family protein disulfide reductase [Pontibacter anaerobius]|uniref:TlpA disulfide reductase family protein n=1 Tax=Pontibacter anaerobius TaxID=2993940 RepID=A0ABT3RFH5_9BACT|nr:TlpA disulfide reductase family protein [Pontibacter anaerobius]MCX2740597.1 TlpA disulfide reductase family protein [Pontibacter anaerobius]